MKELVLLAAVPVTLFGFVVAVVLGGAGAGVGSPSCGAVPAIAATTSQVQDTLKPEQVAYAGVIITTGRRAGLPARAMIIALEAALQASRLRDLGADPGAHRGVGLFGMHPSPTWGNAKQIIDPEYAASTFYGALTRVPHWRTLPVALAAQKVQARATPSAYARWETTATALLASAPTKSSAPDAMTSPAAGAEDEISTCPSGAAPQADGTTSARAAGISLPARTPPAVVTAITWGLAQRGTPYVYGGDCTDAHSLDPTHHCDCSSLMMRAYAAAGIHLPRTTLQQVHAGSGVRDVSHLLPGDLVFIPGSLGSTSHPRHVGMYVGSGLILQAPHTGDTVKTSPLSRWAGEIVAIRRVVP